MLESYDDDGNREIKVVILGLHGSGKTSLVERFVKNEFEDDQRTTQRLHHVSKLINVNNKNISVSFWDLAGQQGPNSIARLYFKIAHVIIFAYDITNTQSFEVAKEWVHAVSLENRCVFVLAGNKCDREESRAILESDAKEYAKLRDMKFVECSARENINVESLFLDAVQSALAMPGRPRGVNLAGSNVPDDANTCC
mmetsp:Transcript_7706/g.15889  ORF Transcript_7706/g.15889 Transcript_7706/m.15889 type:complete len:197 (-) Transcript_7706:97-687(-)